MVVADNGCGSFRFQIDCNRSKWQVEDVPVGPGPEQYMHTLTNSSSSGSEPVQGPAMVLMPGYGAGTGFFFR
jgi:hypothetical protein